MIGRRDLLVLSGSALINSFAARAQQPAQIHRLGYLADRAAPTKSDESFLRGLRELAWHDGQNLVIEYRWEKRGGEPLTSLAADLVARRVDVIFASGTRAALAAKESTTIIPIVFVSGDALASGLVADLARPGGNLTGRTLLGMDLSGKRLELLREAVPSLQRVGVLWNQRNVQTRARFEETEAAARRLAMEIESLDVPIPDGLDRAFAAAARGGASAMLILSDGASTAHRHEIGRLARAFRLPSMFSNRRYLEGGGLMSYGPNLEEVYRQTASYVDRILKGALPGDLAVEQPTKFELVVNLQAAQAIGLEIPPTFLARADEVIE